MAMAMVLTAGRLAAEECRRCCVALLILGTIIISIVAPMED
jgi:hypothetical protein